MSSRKVVGLYVHATGLWGQCLRRISPTDPARIAGSLPHTAAVRCTPLPAHGHCRSDRSWRVAIGNPKRPSRPLDKGCVRIVSEPLGLPWGGWG